MPTKNCVDCGVVLLRTNGPQKRCAPCQKKHRLAYTLEHNKRNAKRGEYRRKNKRFRAFGFNRDAAVERDGGACRKCGDTGHLHVHHIDGRGKGVPVKERNHALDNLVTLCTTCHRQLHVETEKVLFARHPETVLAVFRDFLGEPTQAEPPKAGCH